MDVVLNPNLRVRIIFVWTSVILALLLFSFFWFIAGLVLMPVIDLTIASYAFSSDYLNVVTLIKNVILYLPIIASIGFLIWGAMNSSRHQDFQGEV